MRTEDRNLRDMDGEGILAYLRELGFAGCEEILDMRIFDLLNLNGMHGNRALEVLLILYRGLNPCPVIDGAMDTYIMDQPFPLAAWRRKHRPARDVTVRELVLETGINRRAVEKLFDSICRSFYRSEEYDPRSYRYRDKAEMMQECKAEDKDTD